MQLAVVPPFVPAHVQVHGVVPVTSDAVPVAQRLAVGLVVGIVRVYELLELPQLPFTGGNATKVKIAVTFFAAFMVTLQLLASLLSQPLQLVKLLSLLAVAVRVTVVLGGYFTVPVLLFQPIMPGLPVTMPVPEPAFEMVNRNDPGCPPRTGHA